MAPIKFEESIASKPLSTTLFDELQMDIISGKIRAGAKLTEQKLCKEYNVSRTPVREALRQLEMDGLVESIPNRGSFVIGFSDQDIEDMYQLRKIYEMQAVRWAIVRITKEQLESLQETFEFMEFYTMKRDKEKMLNINSFFHQQIYAASQNKMLARNLASYQIYVKNIRKTPLSSDEYLQRVLEEHRAIFKAFCDGNVEGGVRAMEIHMDNSRRRALTGELD